MNDPIVIQGEFNLIDILGKEKFEKIKPNLICECLSLNFRYYFDRSTPFESFDSGNQNQREMYWIQKRKE